MSKFNKRILATALPLLLIAGIFLLIPYVVSAQIGNPGGGAGIQNPLGKVDSVEALISKVILWLLGLAGILALAALVWGGILYISGFADEKNVEKAKEIIKWAIIGIIITGGAFAILETTLFLLS